MPESFAAGVVGWRYFCGFIESERIGFNPFARRPNLAFVRL